MYLEGVVENRSTPITLVPLMSKMLRETFQMMFLNPNFRQGPNLSIFSFGPWAIIHGMGKLENTNLKVFSKLLSENRLNWIYGNQVTAAERVPK